MACLHWEMCFTLVGGFHTWDSLPKPRPPTFARIAYEKLIGELDLAGAFVSRCRKETKILVTMDRARENSTIWEFSIHQNEMATTCQIGQIIKEPTRSFKVSQGQLLPHEETLSALEVDNTVIRIITGHPKMGPIGRQQLAIVGHL